MAVAAVGERSACCGGGAPSKPTGSNMQPFQEVQWGRKAGTWLIVLTKFYNIIFNMCYGLVIIYGGQVSHLKFDYRITLNLALLSYDFKNINGSATVSHRRHSCEFPQPSAMLLHITS